MLNDGNFGVRVAKKKKILKIRTPLYPMMYITAALVNVLGYKFSFTVVGRLALTQLSREWAALVPTCLQSFEFAA